MFGRDLRARFDTRTSDSPLSTRAEDYLTGWATIDDVPELAVFMAQFRWIPVDETIVEGLHAVLERVMAHVVHRTATSDSLGLRMPFFRVVLAKPPDAKDLTAVFFSVLRTVQGLWQSIWACTGIPQRR